VRRRRRFEGREREKEQFGSEEEKREEGS